MMTSVTEQRREREKEQRRLDILGAARSLFWQRGYTGTTMPDIAEAAELAPGTLYLYFPSKQALYAELLVDGYELLLDRLGAAAAGGGGPRRTAEALMDAFYQFARDCPEYFDVIFFVLQREGTNTRGGALEPEQVARLQAKEDECKAIVASLLQEAGYTGEPEEVQDRIDAAWSMLVGTVFYFRRAGGEKFAGVVQEARKLLLDAVFGGE
jgi:AcrR family transcriptional regulator